MKTMNDFSISCTEEQTRKALELGAPIAIYGYGELHESTLRKYNFIIQNGATYIIPTVEQMIGWLEDKCKIIDFEFINTYYYSVFFEGKHKCTSSGFSTRKEAILAAIDAALEYLKNKEK